MFLPLDVLCEISMFVDHVTLARLMSCSKELNKRLNEEHLWKMRINYHYPGCKYEHISNMKRLGMNYPDIFMAHRRYNFVDIRNAYIDQEFYDELSNIGYKNSGNVPFVILNLFQYDDVKILKYYWNTYYIHDKDTMIMFLNKHYMLAGPNILDFIHNLPNYNTDLTETKARRYILDITYTILYYYLGSGCIGFTSGLPNTLNRLFEFGRSVSPSPLFHDNNQRYTQSIKGFDNVDKMIKHIDFILNLHPWVLEDDSIMKQINDYYTPRHENTELAIYLKRKYGNE